ncbi:MAG TPA: hypothetical protein PKY77_08605 [Phycisphaerae bacterium]|nr:hypothetical protein [Phycisphaerae bacterium]HRY67234.1 hypothetical protein [Phycisphaerae bacterium]HSA26396.1 hypothetical protein [Phycisphaerae bacterium]
MRGRKSTTRLAALAVSVLIGVLPADATPKIEKPSPASQPSPAIKQTWARKLTGLKGGNWRTAFQVGQELAALPPEHGYAILKDNWAKIESVEARQQILKAWYYTLPYPLKPRNHPRLADVLELGTRDPSPEVQQWARELLQKSKTAAETPESQPDPADVAGVPVQDLRAGGDANKRYFLVGPVKAPQVPPQGFRLLIVLPGGDGGADAQFFVRRIHKNVLDKRWLIAQAVAPVWDARQARETVWPTEKSRYPTAKFTTEQFIEAIVADVQAKVKIDTARIFLLGWSSGGPPCYAMSVRKSTPATGAFVAMSVFKSKEMPPLDNARGRAFYLLQSPTDRVTPMRFAEEAEKALQAAGAKVKRETYEGGHGWHGEVWVMIRRGIEWLDQQVGAKD